MMRKNPSTASARPASRRLSSYGLEIHLSPIKREELKTWLALAFDQAVNFNGSQAAEEDLIESLDAVEKIFALAARQNMPREKIETAMINAVNPPPETPRTIYEFLAVASLFYTRLETANDFETTLNILERAGVPAVRNNDLHIPPAAGDIQNATSDDPNKFKIETQPRLAWLIEGLKAKGLYTSDIMITVGETPKNIVRRHPYVIIDIPYVPCQIAVCDQVGERTFISDKIYEMDFWRGFNKELLNATDGVTGFICRTRAQWVGDIVDHITTLRDPSQARVDMKQFAATPQRTKMPITIEAIRDSILATYQETGKWLVQSYGMIKYGALKGQIKCNALDARFRAGKYHGYTSLADFMEKEEFRKNHLNVKTPLINDICHSIRATFEATNKWPTVDSGLIKYGELKDKITWRSLDKYFRRGKYESYASLADFMEKKGFKKHHFNIEVYSLDNIYNSILETYKATGKWPTADHDFVEFGPLKEKIRWSAIDQRFRAGHYGRYTSLANFMERKGLKRNNQTAAAKYFKLSDIRHSMIATFEATKHWPSHAYGLIQYGLLKDQITWHAINSRFTAGKYEGYTSLADFKKQVMAEYEAGQMQTPSPPLTPPAPAP